MLLNLELEYNKSYCERSYGFKAKMIYELISIFMYQEDNPLQ
jgi:hypothetical protein